MKDFVIEILQQKDLAYLFNDRDYKSYRRKTISKSTTPNLYFVAMSIADMFIVNSAGYRFGI